MKIRDLQEALRHAGATPVRCKGSHEVWHLPGLEGHPPARVPLPRNHRNDEVSGAILLTMRRAFAATGRVFRKA